MQSPLDECNISTAAAASCGSRSAENIGDIANEKKNIWWLTTRSFATIQCHQMAGQSSVCFLFDSESNNPTLLSQLHLC